MSKVTPQIRQLSQFLITNEALAQSAATKTGAGFLVCEKLQPQLSILMGKVGYSALLSRALSLSYAEAPWLRDLKIKADGTLEGLDTIIAPETGGGEVALVAQLIQLLITFIGERLTLQMLREAWPKTFPKDFHFGNE